MEQPRFEIDASELEKWVRFASGARLAQHVLPNVGDPAVGSRLHVVDTLYPREKVSDWARGYLSAALEHMILWADHTAPLTFSAGASVVHSFRPVQTIARAAIESAAQAIWLLSADTPREAVRRHLALMRWDLEEQRKAASSGEKQKFKDAEDVFIQFVSAEFDEKDIRPPSYLSVIKAACPVASRDPDEAEYIWRAASGSAHGKRWPALTLQTVVPVSEYEPGQYRTIQVPSAAAISDVLALAHDLIQVGVWTYASQAGADIFALRSAAVEWLASVLPLKPGIERGSLADMADQVVQNGISDSSP